MNERATVTLTRPLRTNITSQTFAFERLEDRALQCTLDMACICCKYKHNSDLLYNFFPPLGRHIITMNMYRRYILTS